MTPPQPALHVVCFGPFELDVTTGELRKRGVRIALQEQPFQVLAMLVESPGQLVTRQALRERLWPEAVFVDFDHGLNKAVAKIRAALGDLAESPRYVETLERRGYRFLAAVTPVAAASPGGVLSAERPVVVRLVWGQRSTPLDEGRHLLGRDPSAVVWIDSAVVSRRHAAITVTASAVTIEDLGSHNGTFVNDRRLVDGPTPLVEGDEIRVGPARMVVHAASPADLTRTASTTD